MSDWLKACGLALGLTLALLAGCEQGLGEVCQVDDDCEIGLSCNTTTGLCQSNAGPAIDAAPTTDSTTPPTDAAPPIDAAPPTDAMPPDAMPPDAMP